MVTAKRQRALLSEETVPTLLDIVEKNIVPWLSAPDPPPILLARPTLKDFRQCNQLAPDGVHCVHRPIRGQSVRPRSNLPIAAYESFVTLWPRDRLIATRTPQLMCVVAGEADMHFGDYLLHLPTGCFCLLPPGVPHTDGSEPHLSEERRSGQHLIEERCDVLWLAGSACGMELWACHSRGGRHWIGNITARVVIQHNEIRSFFATLFKETQSEAKEDYMIAHGVLKALFGIALRELKAGRFYQDVWAAPPPTPEKPWDPIAHIKEYSGKHLRDALTIEQAARACYMAPSRFTARFKQETGQTFNDYLTQLRLNRARELLRDTEWPVQQIAHIVGVHDSHLRRMFERHLGCSPLAFRQQNRKQN
jgi:AraC-like DNA-binding protein